MHLFRNNTYTADPLERTESADLSLVVVSQLKIPVRNRVNILIRMIDGLINDEPERIGIRISLRILNFIPSIG